MRRAAAPNALKGLGVDEVACVEIYHEVVMLQEVSTDEGTLHVHQNEVPVELLAIKDQRECLLSKAGNGLAASGLETGQAA